MSDRTYRSFTSRRLYWGEWRTRMLTGPRCVQDNASWAQRLAGSLHWSSLSLWEMVEFKPSELSVRPLALSRVRVLYCGSNEILSSDLPNMYRHAGRWRGTWPRIDEVGRPSGSWNELDSRPRLVSRQALLYCAVQFRRPDCALRYRKEPWRGGFELTSPRGLALSTLLSLGDLRPLSAFVFCLLVGGFCRRVRSHQFAFSCSAMSKSGPNLHFCMNLPWRQPRPVHSRWYSWSRTKEDAVSHHTSRGSRLRSAARRGLTLGFEECNLAQFKEVERCGDSMLVLFFGELWYDSCELKRNPTRNEVSYSDRIIETTFECVRHLSDDWILSKWQSILPMLAMSTRWKFWKSWHGCKRFSKEWSL